MPVQDTPEKPRLTYEHGTLLLDDPGRVFGAALSTPWVWDTARGRHRAPACAFADVAARADAMNVALVGDLRVQWERAPRPYDALDLRPYQMEALRAWQSAGGRGIVALPTGAGKTRVALAAILESGLPAVVLCPTRALLAAWVSQLSSVLGERIGVFGDGARAIERVTVMTFESAYRHLDALGDRFGILVVDEVHHFAGGGRIEALESCAAPLRLGLSATAPTPGSEGASRLAAVVGPVVLEVTVRELTGTHLAPLSIVRLSVPLDADERARYERLIARYKQAARAFFRGNPGAEYASFVRLLAATPEGRAIMYEHAQASAIAYFPRAKRSLVARLLARHRGERTIVFTARAEDAYRIGEDNLVPVITGDVAAKERERILAKFREGRVTVIVSARVLNEGIDVPDARVAIVAAGTLGAREHVQRIGRILRPGQGKEALAYELVTVDTMDERNAHARGSRALAR